MSSAKLAVRNLWRSPRRTVLTTVAVVAGVAISILGQGFVGGAVESIVAGAINGTVGHVQARPHDYPVEGLQHPVDKLLTVTPEAKALLDRDAVAWTERLYFAPTAAHGRDSLRITAIGYDPEKDAKVFPRDLWKLQGAYPKPGAHEVLVAPRVAALLNVKPGDTLVLQTRTHEGALNALEVTVSGLVRTSNVAIDGWTVLMPKALAQELVATELPSHVSVRLASRDAAEAFAPNLEAAMGAQADVVTWKSETAELVQLQEVRRKALNVIVFVLLALAAFGIANTILMAAHERIREVGTLRSMGMTEGGVLRLFLWEGALIGFVGGVVGAVLGSAVVMHWATHPLDFSAVYEKQMKASFSASPLIYTQFSLSTAVAALVVGTLVAALASIYPARVASRMVPADAVRADS